MKILSSFTHPQVVPNLLNTKEDILKNVKCLYPTDFHSIEKKGLCFYSRIFCIIQSNTGNKFLTISVAVSRPPVMSTDR